MLLLAHTGLTLGAAVLLNSVITGATNRRPGEAVQSSVEVSQARHQPSRRVTSWFVSLGERIDIRLLLIGSLLPDIIDKLLGLWLLRDVISNGRIFSHTLLFLIVITIGGLYLYLSRHRSWLMVLSFGIFTHLLLDQMWLSPRTLFWPLYGYTFERLEFTGFIQQILGILLADPAIYVPEIIGGVVLVVFGWVLVANRKLRVFITRGRL
jgi:membrane-bound metal-dependent hydrolase YbcI (DUF457 family)